ncbi:MAG: HAMP domain-containing sensor histidine kinase, partial [Candidatus Thiodiazotropha sp. 6PLUC9]
TPLSSALLYVSHLANEDLNPHKRQQFTAKLRDRLQHMERQIHDILMFARGEDAGESQILVSHLLQTFSSTVDQELHNSGVTLEIDDQSHGRAIMLGREDALLGLLGNLLENAIQQGAKLVQITLKLGDEIELEIADNGLGIEDELLARIFDPFFTTRSGGTGLGLAVVQNLVLNHGGEIIATHSNSGGALFQMRFPSAADSSEQISTPLFTNQQTTVGVEQRRSLS